MSAGPFQRLLHLGNVVVDLVMDVPALPERGGDVLARDTALAPGGGFNVMAAAARQGLAVSYGGAHGTGPFGDLARAALAAEGIRVLQPPRPDADTGLVVSVVEDGGERTFLTSPGAEAMLNAADLDAVTAGPADIVYVSGYGLAHPANRAALAPWLGRLPGAASSCSTLALWSPGPAGRAGPRPAPRRLADLQRARGHAAVRRGGTGPRPARAQPAARLDAPAGPAGPGTDRAGRLHDWIFPNGTYRGSRHFPSPRWTAMGRATRTLVFSSPRLARGMDVTAAARNANAAAAISVTRRGPATSPTANELARFLSRQSWNSSSRN